MEKARDDTVGFATGSLGGQSSFQVSNKSPYNGDTVRYVSWACPAGNGEGFESLITILNKAQTTTVRRLSCGGLLWDNPCGRFR